MGAIVTDGTDGMLEKDMERLRNECVPSMQAICATDTRMAVHVHHACCGMAMLQGESIRMSGSWSVAAKKTKSCEGSHKEGSPPKCRHGHKGRACSACAACSVAT